MTREQQKELAKLETVQEKARYLLQFEIGATTDIVGLDVVCRATIGEVRLPITGATDEEAIEKAKAWLQEKAA